MSGSPTVVDPRSGPLTVTVGRRPLVMVRYLVGRAVSARERGRNGCEGPAAGRVGIVREDNEGCLPTQRSHQKQLGGIPTGPRVYGSRIPNSISRLAFRSVGSFVY